MTRGGLWCDVVPRGAGFLLLSTQGDSSLTATDEDGVEVWRVRTVEPLWHLRAAALATGAICAIGNGQATGTLQVVVARPDGTVHVSTVPGLVIWGQCLEGNGDHWRGAIQLSPRTWQRIILTQDGTVARGVVQPVPVWPGGDGSTSQGFLQMIDGEPIWSDPHRWLTIEGHLLTLPVRAGAAACGQVEGGAGWVRPGGFYARVIAGETPGPRLAQRGDRYAVCAWTYPDTNTLVIVQPPYPQNQVPEPPPPTPPDPDDGDSPMSNHLDTVRTERAKFPAPAFNDHGVLLNPLGEANAWAITNATAYTWRGEGWGLLEKRTGTNHRGYSIDVLLNVRERQAIDCLGSSETIGAPQWSAMAWEDRFVALWRPPLPPDDQPAPPDPPDPPPPDDLDARVTALERRVATIEAALKTAGAAMP